MTKIKPKKEPMKLLKQKQNDFERYLCGLAKKHNNVTTRLKKNNVEVGIEEGDDGFFQIIVRGKKGFYKFKYYADANQFELDVDGKVAGSVILKANLHRKKR